MQKSVWRRSKPSTYSWQNLHFLPGRQMLIKGPTPMNTENGRVFHQLRGDLDRHLEDRKWWKNEGGDTPVQSVNRGRLWQKTTAVVAASSWRSLANLWVNKSGTETGMGDGVLSPLVFPNCFHVMAHVENRNMSKRTVLRKWLSDPQISYGLSLKLNCLMQHPESKWFSFLISSFTIALLPLHQRKAFFSDLSPWIPSKGIVPR